MSYCYQGPPSPPVKGDKFDRWRSYVETLPWQPGQLDDASYYAFLRAGSLGIDQQTALDAVAERIKAADAHLRARKLESQLERAYRHVSAPDNGTMVLAPAPSPHHHTWPVRDPGLVDRVNAGGPGLYELWESSPVRFDDEDAHTEELVDALFPGNPLLCVGQASHQFVTEQREEYWRGSLDQHQFIVPCFMTAKTGLTLEGKESAHCLANTGARRFLVVEFDQGTPDEQAALLDYLSHRGPLALVVHSGGKSLHGWFYCTNTPDEVLRRFMVLARRLGADLATWRNRSQFVRMPDGRRAPGGNRQTVFYFNPEIL